VAGTAISTTVSGGYMEVNDGTALDTTINAGGTLDVTGTGFGTRMGSS